MFVSILHPVEQQILVPFHFIEHKQTEEVTSECFEW